MVSSDQSVAQESCALLYKHRLCCLVTLRLRVISLLESDVPSLRSCTAVMLGMPRRNNKFGTKSSSVVSSVRFERVCVCMYAGNGRCYNGPQFVPEEFRLFMNTNNIQHICATQLWLQANGEVERQNRTLLKAIRIAHAQGQDWRKELRTFLLSYRSTPHPTTGVSPAELLFKRKIRTKLPELDSGIKTEIDKTVGDRDRAQKERGKLYTDRKRNAKETEVAVGDEVLLQQKKTRTNSQVSMSQNHTK